MDWLKKNAKGLATLVVAAVGALAVALGPGDLSLGDLDTRDWLEYAAAVLGSGAFVALLTNVHGVAGGIAKAAAAFFTAGIGSLILAMNPDSVGGEKITQAEYLGAFVVAALASGAVYQIAEPPKDA